MRRTYKKRGGDLNNTPLNNTPLNNTPSITIKKPNGTEFTLPKKKPNSKINLSIRESLNDEIKRSKEMISTHLKSYKNSMKKMESKNLQNILSTGKLPEEELEQIRLYGNPDELSNNNAAKKYVNNILNTAK
jgi:hypothetical protein